MTYPPLDGHPRISIDPAIMVGKPCIKGSRITVELLLTFLAAGDTQEELLADYPWLTKDDLAAALSYAASAMHPQRDWDRDAAE